MTSANATHSGIKLWQSREERRMYHATEATRLTLIWRNCTDFEESARLRRQIIEHIAKAQPRGRAARYLKRMGA